MTAATGIGMNTPVAPTGRIRATPYARRLARERQLPLAALIGSGPGGRIQANDVAAFAHHATAAVETPSEMLTAIATAPATAPQPATSLPHAIAVGVSLAAANDLLDQLAQLRPAIPLQDIVLKAVAIALAESAFPNARDDCLLLLESGGTVALRGMATGSLGAIAAMRARHSAQGPFALAVSFITRPGIRPVAARLVTDTAARLIVGAPGGDGIAECLLSYDPERIGDDAAADFLDSLRGLLETPLRILV